MEFIGKIWHLYQSMLLWQIIQFFSQADIITNTDMTHSVLLEIKLFNKRTKKIGGIFPKRIRKKGSEIIPVKKMKLFLRGNNLPLKW